MGKLWTNEAGQSLNSWTGSNSCIVCIHVECTVCANVCMYLYVWSYWTLPFVLPTLCVCVCIYMCIFSFLLFLTSPKELKEFIVFPLATESASPSKLSFVPSKKSLLSNFPNHRLPLAAALVSIWTDLVSGSKHRPPAAACLGLPAPWMPKLVLGILAPWLTHLLLYCSRNSNEICYQYCAVCISIVS